MSVIAPAKIAVPALPLVEERFERIAVADHFFVAEVERVGELAAQVRFDVAGDPLVERADVALADALVAERAVLVGAADFGPAGKVEDSGELLPDPLGHHSRRIRKLWRRIDAVAGDDLVADLLRGNVERFQHAVGGRVFELRVLERREASRPAHREQHVGARWQERDPLPPPLGRHAQQPNARARGNVLNLREADRPRPLPRRAGPDRRVVGVQRHATQQNHPVPFHQLIVVPHLDVGDLFVALADPRHLLERHLVAETRQRRGRSCNGLRIPAPLPRGKNTKIRTARISAMAQTRKVNLPSSARGGAGPA